MRAGMAGLPSRRVLEAAGVNVLNHIPRHQCREFHPSVTGVQFPAEGQYEVLQRHFHPFRFLLIHHLYPKTRLFLLFIAIMIP